MRPPVSRHFIVRILLLGISISAAWVMVDAVTDRRQAREVWARHEAVLRAVAEGDRVSLNEFHEAAVFFESLTGIHVPHDHSALDGGFPITDTPSVIEPLQKWYERHGSRLYWDEGTETVKLAERWINWP